jgi:phage FluMu protein Com
MSTAKEEQVRLRCECGAILAAKRTQTRRKGRCPRCRRIIEIPAPDEVVFLEAVEGEAEAVQEMCSICQTALEEQDARITCDACGLPFHPECWQENLGCAAYGCRNVNRLKPGPDISLAGLAPAAPAYRPPSHPAFQPAGPHQDLPWDYLLLGSSALGCLLSVVTCGVPSLLVGVLSILYATRHADEDRRIIVFGLVLCGLGFLFGLGLSALFWLL